MISIIHATSTLTTNCYAWTPTLMPKGLCKLAIVYTSARTTHKGKERANGKNSKLRPHNPKGLRMCTRRPRMQCQCVFHVALISFVLVTLGRRMIHAFTPFESLASSHALINTINLSKGPSIHMSNCVANANFYTSLKTNVTNSISHTAIPNKS